MIIVVRQVGQSLAAGARDVPWIKLHFGPIVLNERLAAGYASWSFEDCPSVKIDSDSSYSMLDTSYSDDVYKHRNSISGAGGNSGRRCLTFDCWSPCVVCK